LSQTAGAACCVEDLRLKNVSRCSAGGRSEIANQLRLSINIFIRKENEPMKNLKKGLSLFLVCCYLFCLIFVPQLSASSEENNQTKLQAKVNTYLKQNQYAELLDYLNSLEGAETKESSYYLVLAKSLFLDYLEKNELWEKYYDNVKTFDAEIIASAKQAETIFSEQSVDLQYWAWKAYLREEDNFARQAFNNFVAMLIEFTSKNADAGKFKKVIERMSKEGNMADLYRLCKQYKDYLVKTNAGTQEIEFLSAIANDYFMYNDIDTAVVIYEQYVNLVPDNYPKDEAYKILISIADKFRDYSFWPADNSEFAEKIYLFVEKCLGLDSFTEFDLFARAANLEFLEDYQTALKLYKKFIGKFTESQLLPEAYLRVGVIYTYYLANKEKGMEYFNKLTQKENDSLLSCFCAYHCGLLLQWQDEFEKAKSIYRRLSDKKNQIAQMAQQRLDEFSLGEELSREIKYPLDLLFNGGLNSSVKMGLKILPQKAFVGQEIKILGIAQDYSAGTVQPFFAYQWRGDIGSVGTVNNASEFTTTYDLPGPKLVCFSVKTENNEGVIYRVLWVYDVKILNSEQLKQVKPQTDEVKKNVELQAKIIPFISEKNIFNYKWKVVGAEDISQQGKNFSYTFQNSGTYECELEVSTLAAKTVKKISFEVKE